MRVIEDSSRIIILDENSIIYNIRNTGSEFILEGTFDCTPYNIIPSKYLAVNGDGTEAVVRG